MGPGGITRCKIRGIALATSLMLSVLILVLGIALLSSSQRDLFFQRQAKAKDQADVLARSGLEHALFLLNQTPPELNSNLPTDTPQAYTVNATEAFTLERRRDSGSGFFILVAKGLVYKGNGDVLASRTLIVPYGPDGVITEAEFETQTYSPEL